MSVTSTRQKYKRRLQRVHVVQVFVICCAAAYTEIGGDEELPLGEEFQEHLKRFVRPGEKKIQKRIEYIQKLIDQLQ